MYRLLSRVIDFRLAIFHLPSFVSGRFRPANASIVHSIYTYNSDRLQNSKRIIKKIFALWRRAISGVAVATPRLENLPCRVNSLKRPDLDARRPAASSPEACSLKSDAFSTRGVA